MIAGLSLLATGVQNGMKWIPWLLLIIAAALFLVGLATINVALTSLPIAVAANAVLKLFSIPMPEAMQKLQIAYPARWINEGPPVSPGIANDLNFGRILDAARLRKVRLYGAYPGSPFIAPIPHDIAELVFQRNVTGDQLIIAGKPVVHSLRVGRIGMARLIRQVKKG